MAKASRALLTRLVHGHGASTHAGVSPVLDRSSTFRLDDAAEQALATREGHDAFDVYGRFGTRTTREAAALVAALEGSESALLFASGMGAIASSLLALAKPGTPVAVAAGVYGGTEGFVAGELPARGHTLIRFDASHPEDLRARVGDGPKPSIVWCESLSNPLLEVADLEGLAALAHSWGALLCVDATFAAGMAQRPLELGADLVVHSATKFINGHSDVIAGAVAGSEALVSRVFSVMSYYGSCIDPAGAWLLARGLRTLPLRYARQSETATRLAASLDAHPKVARVFHPSLASHPSRALADTQLQMPGGVLSFELSSGAEALAFCRALELCAFAVSLGGLETLVAIPRRSSHVGHTPAHWEGVGIREGLVRISVGIEDPDDLWADIEQALVRVGAQFSE